ncbi:MAG TPA: outer membrane lipoprotein chaperone LolA [Vicinamibacterales bacterium]|jgi:outer membrane lipoprotein carrier protein|nr:outer membrane lipoprotein chaperone LolA [Vicinamibacterales bacterium]
MSPFRALFALLAVPLLVSAQSGPASLSAEEAARAVQRHYDQVKDFTADFTHTYQGGVLKKTVTERGMVQIKKPGKMRWEYTSPERKTFVSDGHKIYSFVPADRQVVVTDMPREDEATTAVLFLAGKGDVSRDFSVRFADNQADEGWALHLEPRHKQRDYDWLVLVADRKTWQIRSLTAADRQGGTSTFDFTNYRENTGLSDKIFAFSIPRGVDVITSGGSD